MSTAVVRPGIAMSILHPSQPSPIYHRHVPPAPDPTQPHPIPPCPTPAHPAQSHPILAHPITSQPSPSQPSPSDPNPSHPIASCPTTPHFTPAAPAPFQGLGDIFAIRVAGNVYGGPVRGSIEYAVTQLKVKLVVGVLHLAICYLVRTT